MTIVEDPPLDIPTPSGPMRTYLLRPADGGRYPGLVLFSEIFQITGPVRRLAAVFAGAGYVVALPEVYHELEPAGTVLAYDTEGADRGNAHKTTKPLAAFDADARAVLGMLQAHPNCTGRLGAVGMCLGGHLAYRAALNPDVRATVCFYATDLHTHSLGLGRADDSLDRAADITGDLLMVWGRQDPHVPREGRRLIQDALDDAGVTLQWHEFNAAHAFLRDEGPRHDPALARLCSDLALDLLGRALAEAKAEG